MKNREKYAKIFVKKSVDMGLIWENNVWVGGFFHFRSAHHPRHFSGQLSPPPPPEPKLRFLMVCFNKEPIETTNPPVDSTDALHRLQIKYAENKANAHESVDRLTEKLRKDIKISTTIKG